MSNVFSSDIVQLLSNSAPPNLLKSIFFLRSSFLYVFPFLHYLFLSERGGSVTVFLPIDQNYPLRLKWPLPSCLSAFYPISPVGVLASPSNFWPFLRWATGRLQNPPPHPPLLIAIS